MTADSGVVLTEPRPSRGAAFGDFDNDGDVDVAVINMNEPPSLLRNDCSAKNSWLKVNVSGRSLTALQLVPACEWSQAGIPR